MMDLQRIFYLLVQDFGEPNKSMLVLVGNLPNQSTKSRWNFWHFYICQYKSLKWFYFLRIKKLVVSKPMPPTSIKFPNIIFILSTKPCSPNQKNKICTIIISQDLIMFKQGFIFTVLTILALWWAGAFHVIDSGHIGVYKRGGAMLDSWTQPGLHFMIPFITKFHQVQVTLQTDQVRNIPCGTSSGVILNFDKIEVVNRLKKQLAHQTIKNYTVTYDQTWIFSKIHHEINQFCSSHTLQEVLIDKFNVLDESLKESLQKGCQTWAPGIEIIAVRVTKPTVPAAIAETFEDREVERTKLLIKRQEQRLTEKQSQIEKKISKIKAETESKAGEIINKMNLLEKQANKKVADIENKIVVIKEAAYAKAKKYRQQKLIQLNERRLIPQKELQNMLNNIKNSQKTVYQSNLQQYLQSGIKLIQERSQRAAQQAGTSKKSKQ